jgi:hypothetical protein
VGLVIHFRQIYTVNKCIGKYSNIGLNFMINVVMQLIII